MNKNGNQRNGGKKKVLDLNTKILISIRDELRDIKGVVQEHTKILNDHTTILNEHTTILNEHTVRITALESAVKEMARQLKRWVAHFDTDYLRLANEVDSIRGRLQKCEDRLAT